MEYVLGESPPLPYRIGLWYGLPRNLGDMGIYEGSNYWDEDLMHRYAMWTIKYLEATFGCAEGAKA